jgi:hypothetical protein
MHIRVKTENWSILYVYVREHTLQKYSYSEKTMCRSQMLFGCTIRISAEQIEHLYGLMRQ